MTIRSTLLLAFSALVALPACADEPYVDPVWGDWEGNSNGCPARTEFEVDDDYRGDGRIVLQDCTVCEVNLDIEPEDDGEYEFEVAGVNCQGTIDLDCEIDDDELECEDSVGTRYDFERDG